MTELDHYVIEIPDVEMGDSVLRLSAITYLDAECHDSDRP